MIGRLRFLSSKTKNMVRYSCMHVEDGKRREKHESS